MNAIRRHALGLGVVLFAAGAFLALSPIERSGFGCGSVIWHNDDTLRRVEVDTPEGTTIEVPAPADLEGRSECHDRRTTQTTVALAIVVAGLLGVFWTVVGPPDAQRRPREGFFSGT